MKKNWYLAPKVNKELIDKYKQIPEFLLQFLVNRKVLESEFVSFLENNEVNFLDPFLFSDMERAVEKIIYHIKSQHKILVYGDYDADGITSTSLLFDVLSTLKAEVDTYIPDRVSEGYGLNEQAIREAQSRGAKLIITVDNGVRNKKEIALAQKLGIEVIVTDHHSFPENKEDWPECLIINPSNPEDGFPYKKLAGVGTAFKLAQALVSSSKLKTEDKNKLLNKQLDLVALGTIADLVPLTGENRALVREGLKVINKSLSSLGKGRQGLYQLAKLAGLSSEKDLESWNIAFQLAPRLNASSRIEHADTAVKLLTTSNRQEARSLAQELNLKNQKRQLITEEIFSEAEEILKDDKNLAKVALCPETKKWNEGVIGLVSSKLTSKHYLPSLVITRTEEENGKVGFKGSGRSIEEFNLMEALEDLSDYLDKYGGHPLACGFSIYSEDKLDKFIAGFIDIANKKLKDKHLEPKLEIDIELDPEMITEDLMLECDKMRPYGKDNPRPLLISKKQRVDDIMTMGDKGQHVKIKVQDFWAIAFSQSEKFKDVKPGDIIDLVFYPEYNHFNGKKTIQFKIIDFYKHG
ncbi:MAG: single-stranded-DNA-specific exonuclease RecJ [Candidatus Pacebacteria bacterium]|nr:single-stranded-DNA-specific exonuclease RecJ [Candidatus Paceibacterota bacterium]